ELAAAPRRLVVEQNAAGAEHAVAFAIVHGDPMPIGLGHAVGTARVEWRCLTLGSLPDLAVHLAAAGLVKAYVPGIEQPNCLQHGCHANGGELSGEHGLLPARRHETHGREVIHFVGLNLLHHVDKGELVEQVCLMQADLASEMPNALETLRAGPAHDAV